VSVAEQGANARVDFVARDETRLAALDGRDAAGDFVSPFGRQRLAPITQAAGERFEQGCALLRGKRERALEKVVGSGAHAPSIDVPNGDGCRPCSTFVP